MDRFFAWYFDLPYDSENSGVWKIHHSLDSFDPVSWLVLCVSLFGIVLICSRRLHDVVQSVTRVSIIAALSSLCFIVCWMALISGVYFTYGARTRPVLFVFIDNSQSMASEDHVSHRGYQRFIRKHSTNHQSNRLKLIETVNSSKPIEDLYSKFDVRYFLVSDAVREVSSVSELSVDGDSSQLPILIRNTVDNQNERRISGVIIWTDGRVVPKETTTWLDLSKFLVARNIPLYAIGVGVESVTRDASLHGIFAPEQILPGEELVISGQVETTGFVENEELSVILSDMSTNRIYDQTSIKISRTKESGSFSLKTDSLQFGNNKLLVTLQQSEGDLRPRNNRWVGEVEVVEQPFRVLLVASQPNYDLRNLQKMLQRQNGVDVDIFLREPSETNAIENSHVFSELPDFESLRSNYEIVVIFNSRDLQDVPSESLLAFANEGGSIVLIDDTSDSLVTQNQNAWMELFPYKTTPTSTTSPEALLPNDGIEGFKQIVLTPSGIRSRLLQYFQKIAQSSDPNESDSPTVTLPSQPLKSVSGNLFLKNTSILAETTIDHVPVFAIKRQGIGLVFWSGVSRFWLWKAHKDGESYSRIWMQILPTMASMSRKNFVSQSQLSTDRDQYTVGDSIVFKAIGFSSESPTDESEDQITIQVMRNGVFYTVYQLQRESSISNSFFGQATIEETGNYVATVINKAETLQSSPQALFQVTTSHSELSDMTPAHQELRVAATNSNGEFVRIDQCASMPNKIQGIDSPPSNPTHVFILNRLDFLCVTLFFFGMEIYFARVRASHQRSIRRHDK